MPNQINSYTTDNIEPPGAGNTYATGLNNSGQIVGYTSSPSGSSGFIYHAGTFSILPMAVLPVPLAINNAGEVVGGFEGPDHNEDLFVYQNGTVEGFTPPGDAFLGGIGVNESGVVIGNIYANDNNRGFIFDQGTFTDLRTDFRATFGLHGLGDDSGGDFRAVTTGINDAGEVVGIYRAVASDSDNSPRFGFIDYQGTVTVLQVPGTTNTDALAVNNTGEIVGASNLGGFIYQNGSYTNLNDPNAAAGTTAAVGVNDRGDIIGNYKDPNGTSHGFAYLAGTYITIDAPGAVSTTLSDINGTGEIIGNYTASDGTHHAFLANPVSAGASLSLIKPTLNYNVAEGQTLQGLYDQLLANAQDVGSADQVQLSISSIGQSDTLGFLDFDPSRHLLTYTADGFNAKQPTDSFRYTISDSHGGTATGTVDVTIAGSNRSTQLGTTGADNLTANGSGLRLIGGDGNDNLTGHGASQLIFGGRGDDTVTADGAKSVIYGGPGTNTVALHGNRETVVLQQDGIDEISGFKLNSDVLELKQVLAEAQINLGGDIGRLSDYITVSTSGRDVTLSFSPDGAGSGTGTPLAVLQGVGSNISLNTLINDGGLRIA